mgnify:CR=1 FL=1
MKSCYTLVIFVIFTVGLFADWAPESGRRIGAEIRVTSGSGFLASRGTAVLYTALEESRYSLLGDSNIETSYGTYQWNKISENQVALRLYDEFAGTGVTYNLTFTSADSGTFSVNEPGIGTQAGTFDYYLTDLSKKA